MRLSHPVPSQPASVRACRHAGTGEKFPPFASAVAPLLTSIKIFLQAFFAAERGRKARAAAAVAAIVHRFRRDRRGGEDTARSPRAEESVRSRDPGAKRANVKTCLLRFYFGYCSLFSPPFLSSYPPPLFPYPLVSPPQKAIINLHFITQLQEEKEAEEAESTTSR